MALGIALNPSYYQLTLYSTDGIDWHSIDGEQVIFSGFLRARMTG
jgi:hypothetical protein